MKIGFYDPYLDQLGGGEKVLLTILETAVRDGHEVTLLAHEDVEPARWARLGVDVARPDYTFRKVGPLSVTPATRGLDLFVVLHNFLPPVSLARRSAVVLQFPFRTVGASGFWRRPEEWLRIRGYRPWVVYSDFVKRHVHERVGVDDVVVIPPPADTDRGAAGPKGRSVIAVGRFFPSTDSNNKKHPLMIDAFKRLGADGWTFHLVGGAFDREDVHAYLEELHEQAAGAAIELHPNASIEELDALYRDASLFWHAAGYGETDPEKLEHFGITTVEAMAYGCVPVVPALGGQLEIVTDGVDGRLWTTPDELVTMTRELITGDAERERLAAAAVPSAQRFSKAEFVRRVREQLFAPAAAAAR